MSKRISLSRAARLVGVKRGSLQLKIRQGELKTFEGEIVLSDLLQSYPDAQIEDSSMLERVEQIIENANFSTFYDEHRRSDKLILSERVKSLSRELLRTQGKLKSTELMLAELLIRLKPEEYDNDENLSHRQWLMDSLEAIKNEKYESEMQLANEVFLRTMSAQATILASGHEFFIEGAESILEAGLRGGLALNYGCSNGNCGLCKMRVVSGETQKIRHHDYSLTEAEKGLGYVLSCSSTAVSDLVLEAEEANHAGDIPRQNIPIRLKRLDRIGDDMLIVSSKTPRTNRLRFLAGQQALLTANDGSSGVYPIASCPCDDMNLQFHIAVKNDDPFSLYLASSAKLNDEIDLSGPQGSFALNENSPNSLIFIAESTGFATIKGLIEHAMALDTAERILLFWIVDEAEGLYMNNLCRAWNDALDNFQYIPVIASTDSSLDGILDNTIAPASADAFDYYLCGGDRVEQLMARMIEAKSIPEAQFNFDRNQPATGKQA
jgi:CDP-4-dehydro-6-deoxyglucose reductase